MSKTTFNWIDQSYLQAETAVREYPNKTLFLAMLTSDKGTEDMIRVYGDDFYKQVGRVLSFEKHGQPLLQAKKIIDAGGELLMKRFVAEDATLSNIIVVANVSEKRTPVTNENDEPLYIDATTGEQTTNETADDGHTPNKAVEDVVAVVKYELQTVENAKTLDEVHNAAVALYNDEDGKYPILIATDIGRNADIKRLAIVPDYATSFSLGYAIYTFKEFEKTANEESVTVIMNPGVVFKKKSYMPRKDSMTQLYLDSIEGVYEAFAAKIADIAAVDYNSVLPEDLFFGKTIRGKALPYLQIDPEGADLGYMYGIELKSGSNGTAYGDTPYKSEACNTDMIKFLGGIEQGGPTDEIFDKDIHKLSIIMDANYDIKVKKAIAELVNFREDCVYLRDYGLNIHTFKEIKEYNDKQEIIKSKFIADYITTYQTYDPYTDKRITVTLPYGMVEAVVKHCQGSPTNPFAGEINDFVIRDVIPGTVNYKPTTTPSIDQKEQLKELRVNYATFFENGGPLVVDSLFTSQDKLSQLSYVSNVIGIQEVMRAIRSECPRNRFKFSNGNDFIEYKEAVDNVLRRYRSNFESLQMKYQQDPIKISQKLFYAVILFRFNNWAEDEVFDLYALNMEEE